MHFKCFTEWWFQNPFEKIYRKLNRFKPEFLVFLVEYLWPLSITLPLLLHPQWNKKSSTWLISWLTAFAIFWLLLLLFARNWLWQVNCSGISHWNIYLTPPLNTPLNIWLQLISWITHAMVFFYFGVANNEQTVCPQWNIYPLFIFQHPAEEILQRFPCISSRIGE